MLDSPLMVIHQNFSDPYLTPRQWSIVPRWRNYKKTDGASTFTGDGFICSMSVLDYISDVIIYCRTSNGGWRRQGMRELSHQLISWSVADSRKYFCLISILFQHFTLKEHFKCLEMTQCFLLEKVKMSKFLWIDLVLSLVCVYIRV